MIAHRHKLVHFSGRTGQIAEVCTESSAPQLGSRQRRCGISDGPWRSASPQKGGHGPWQEVHPQRFKTESAGDGIQKKSFENCCVQFGRICPSPSLWVPYELLGAWHQAHRSLPLNPSAVLRQIGSSPTWKYSSSYDMMHPSPTGWEDEAHLLAMTGPECVDPRNASFKPLADDLVPFYHPVLLNSPMSFIELGSLRSASAQDAAGGFPALNSWYLLGSPLFIPSEDGPIGTELLAQIRKFSTNKLVCCPSPPACTNHQIWCNQPKL